MGTKNEGLFSAVAQKTYSNFGGDINLLTDLPGGLSAGMGVPCRRVMINSAGGGALSVKFDNGCTDTITNLQPGSVLDAQYVMIVASGTTVLSITVFW